MQARLKYKAVRKELIIAVLLMGLSGLQETLNFLEVNGGTYNMNKLYFAKSGGGLRPLVTGELHKWGAAHERTDKRDERDCAP